MQVEAKTVDFVDEQEAEQSLPFDHLVLAHDWEPDEELVESLHGGDYQLIAVGPCQQPGQYVQAFREGTSIGRAI